MNYPHGNLTPEQIRSTFFSVPDLGIVMALGTKYLAAFKGHRDDARGGDGELLLIAWPGGTLLEYKRLKPAAKLDSDDLAAMYRVFTILERIQKSLESNHEA